MSAYRFCRTDDIGLLVDALNRCWSPYFPDEPAMTPEAFKRSIRDLQVWCSSCMVAFSGSDPIGVLIGAKRPSGTLIHRIAVHPDHLRQGHGRHLLTSLSSKLAILGPPRIVAEVPATLTAGCALFTACDYVEEAALTDYVWQGEGTRAPEIPGRFVIPVTIDDLNANGLLDEAGPKACWERSAESLMARKDEIAGIAVATGERIEACMLYVRSETGPDRGVDVVVLRSFIEDGGVRLRTLLARLGSGLFRFNKVHPTEVSKEVFEALGFRPVMKHRLYGATARAA